MENVTEMEGLQIHNCKNQRRNTKINQRDNSQTQRNVITIGFRKSFMQLLPLC